jgi:hypothetical protein
LRDALLLVSRKSLFEVRLTVPVSRETAVALQRLAAADEEPVSTLVRRAIRGFLREHAATDGADMRGNRS